MATQLLRPYRRHTPNCISNLGSGQTPSAKLAKLTSAQRLSWPECQCPCYVRGVWNGHRYDRESLNTTDWKTAVLAVEKLMRVAAPQGKKTSIAAAFELWHSASTKRADSTKYWHRKIHDGLLSFLERQKYQTDDIRELDTAALTEWRNEWNFAETTERTWLTYTSGFLNFCMKTTPRLIDRNPMVGIERPPVRPASKEDTKPIDLDGGDQNYRKVLTALATPKEKRGWTTGPRRKNGAKVEISIEHQILLTEMMYESGFRISDAFLFDWTALKKERGCYSYTYVPHKTRRNGKRYTTFMPTTLAERILATQPLNRTTPFFDPGMGSLDEFKGAMWRAYQAAGLLAKVENVHAHRFRNSFAVNRLNRGAGYKTVANMIGHASARTTEEYYSPHVQSRHDAAHEEYLRTNAPAPASNVVSIA